jgi:nicotinamide mononucleotide transporter
MAEVETRKLSYGQNWLVALLVFFGVMILYGFLGGTDDTQPFMDSVTTVPAFMAQILMILRFRESWVYWLIIDIGSIVMWAIAEDWCMVSQFVFWSINCLYGLRKW